jgi:hypothetical protein
MELDEYLKYRDDLLDRSKDDDGMITEPRLLEEVMPSLLDSKQVDSEEISNSYILSSSDLYKVNAYQVNDSGERLQIFIVNEDSIDLSKGNKELLVSQKSEYENQFKRVTRFINKAIKGHLNDEIQDSDPSRPLITHLSSSEGAHQFDVVEIFLISATATVSLSGAQPAPKRIDFEDEELKISYTRNRKKFSKDLLIKKRLVDLNFLYNVLISEGNREALVIDFDKSFGSNIQAIKAADEINFESYLCVLPASTIAKLYKDHSSRLLEKNVRSFLQLRNETNKGIRETIRKEPEKFIAYNNGLTITATKGEILHEGGKYYIKSLTDFQIVNGGQTTATIYFTSKDGFDISKVNIMAKINIAKESSADELEELISNISTYSNAQSRVSKVDLRSRNPQLVQLKALTESVLTPSGRKWFFERSKGEFNTMLRIAGSRKNAIQKDFPSDKRFSKEQLAKYYTAWGEQPFLVKKGGEKVFRAFIEELSGDGSKKKPLQVDRTFYEELIAKMTFFRRMEKIYGQGKNSMGQIRSAVVPYTLSVLYKHTDGGKKTDHFDLLKVWKSEKLEDDLDTYVTHLLGLVNELIKKYSQSDDLGEYSKKPELWNDIIESKEVKEFMSSEDTRTILSKYSLPENERLKRLKARKGVIPVDFSLISANALIQANGANYYKKIASLYGGEMTANDDRKLSIIIESIAQFRDLDREYLSFEKNLINEIRVKRPELFDLVPQEKYLRFIDTLDYIMSKYNSIVDSSADLESEFNTLEMLAAAKGLKYTGVIHAIEKQLSVGEAPSVQQLDHASHCLIKKNVDNIDLISKSSDRKVLSDLDLRKMVEWDARNKVLSENQREYISNFAYGFKVPNEKHKQILKNYLSTLTLSGFEL